MTDQPTKWSFDNARLTMFSYHMVRVDYWMDRMANRYLTTPKPTTKAIAAAIRAAVEES